MSLRVTQSMMSNQLLRNVSNNLGRMNNLQNQLSTGKQINAPSDDPVGLTFAMRYRSEISANDQYIRNVDSAKSSLDYTDMVLSQVGDVLHRVRELMVKGADGTVPQTGYDAIKLEIDELFNQLVEIGNSKFNGKYVFNGEMTETAPYPTTTINNANPDAPKVYQVATDDKQIRYELAPGMVLGVNITGNDLFGMPVDETNGPVEESDNMFYVLKQVSEALGAGDNQKVSSLLGNIDSRINILLEQRAEIGARSNRVSLVEGRLEDISVNLMTIKSKTEDADLAMVITNLKMEENVYQASLSAGAKIIKPSLIDFLR
ncbi:flagellar hook-associated protein FlgL [Paenibacillus sp. 598K]|uniref:flagellar hook-associated protein FlgL n=1 Tax=Paenibacillus sp. 598K TaxID=1117987 RepID=UPI000FFA5463|nr:flagellar hook-associated protein FlgL [Paenibacillus sp. 598K]GBF76284.1 flagellar hook-associated protein FlgL [Paenibacillus sp. 598K]